LRGFFTLPSGYERLEMDDQFIVVQEKKRIDVWRLDDALAGKDVKLSSYVHNGNVANIRLKSSGENAELIFTDSKGKLFLWNFLVDKTNYSSVFHWHASAISDVSVSHNGKLILSSLFIPKIM
jgi:WD40 repeat protein